MTTTDLGSLVSDTDRPTIRFERRLRAPVERVWRAVTEEGEMRSWFPAGVEGERTVGAPLRFPFEHGEADTFDGEVTAWEPMKVFAFTWNGEELRLELTPAGDETVLVFTHAITDLSQGARTASGWHACLANLDAHLGGPPAPPEAWREVYDDYLDTMGPPLGVPAADGSMTWERVHHASADDVRAAIADVPSWGGAEDGARWEVEGLEHGTRYVLTVADVGRDAAMAARWHARLIQLDMVMSSHQLVPVDSEKFTERYAALLS